MAQRWRVLNCPTPPITSAPHLAAWRWLLPEVMHSFFAIMYNHSVRYTLTIVSQKSHPEVKMIITYIFSLHRLWLSAGSCSPSQGHRHLQNTWRVIDLTEQQAAPDGCSRHGFAFRPLSCWKVISSLSVQRNLISRCRPLHLSAHQLRAREQARKKKRIKSDFLNRFLILWRRID